MNAQGWGLVKERLIAFSLVILAGISPSFPPWLVAFWQSHRSPHPVHLGHGVSDLFILLMVDGHSWLIAASPASL